MLGQSYVICRLRQHFAQFRQVGLEAERAMFEATEGINTHKGAIFSLGIFLSYLWSFNDFGRPLAPYNCFATNASKQMTARLIG